MQRRCLFYKVLSLCTFAEIEATLILWLEVFFLSQNDRQKWTKIFHRFGGKTVVFFAFQLFVRSFFLVWCQTQEYNTCFFFASLLAGHSLCPQKLELGSMDAPHEIGHFFLGGIQT